MQPVRQLGMAILIALISLALVVGGFSLALSESFTKAEPTATLYQPTAPFFVTATNTMAAPLILPTETALPTFTSTPLPPPACIPPAGWTAITVQPSDTLAVLAVRYNTTSAQLITANCLLSESLVAGSTLFVPPIFVNNTPIPCGPPLGWVRYTVQPGDTLSRISNMYATTISLLQQANCLGTSTAIRTGQLLWVPNVPPRLPSITPGVTVVPEFPTVTSVPTDVPTEPLTETPPPPTNTSEPPTAVPTEPLPTDTLTPFPP